MAETPSLPVASGPPNVLLTSVGRRVSLLRAFAAAAHHRGGRIYAADMDPTAPGLYVADGAALVPRVTAADYIDRLLELVDRWRVRLVVPLIDPELPVLAAARDRLLVAGAMPLVPSAEVVRLGWDKLATADLFDRLGVAGPRTARWSPDLTPWPGPWVVKPRFGSNSAGVARCETWDEVAHHARRIDEPIVQTWLAGAEVTVDVLCDFAGRLLHCVPRRRLKVRAGEVERAVTIADAALTEPLGRLIGGLAPAGVINVQYFATPEGPRFTEINPRFGGGYPLAHAAGADFPSAILALLAGEAVEPAVDGYARGLHMLRYDAEVFRQADGLIER